MFLKKKNGLIDEEEVRGDVDAVTSLVRLMTYVPRVCSGVVRFASKLSDRLFGPALATAVAAGQPGRDREKKWRLRPPRVVTDPRAYSRS